VRARLAEDREQCEPPAALRLPRALLQGDVIARHYGLAGAALRSRVRSIYTVMGSPTSSDAAA
jgi:hypothetical protein